MIYAHCLRECGIPTSETEYFELPNGLSAFATKRFDRHLGMRVPMQSLAAFTGADYQIAGSLDYTSFLRATQICTNDVSEKIRAFERVVFNVIFNNRDDHPKNFAYIMSSSGEWALAPAFDVTYCDGPGGYHQMDVMGEALNISREQIVKLGTQEAELSEPEVSQIVERISDVAAGFTKKARAILPGGITHNTLDYIQSQIDCNINRLR